MRRLQAPAIHKARAEGEPCGSSRLGGVPRRWEARLAGAASLSSLPRASRFGVLVSLASLVAGQCLRTCPEAESSIRLQASCLALPPPSPMSVGGRPTPSLGERDGLDRLLPEPFYQALLLQRLDEPDSPRHQPPPIGYKLKLPQPPE